MNFKNEFIDLPSEVEDLQIMDEDINRTFKYEAIPSFTDNDKVSKATYEDSLVVEA